MDIYKISFEQIRQRPGLNEMLQALERGFTKFRIDYYLVGAVSRDVWLSGIHKFKPRRTTRDIDFAILINEKGIYEELKNYLIEMEGFNSYRENAFVLIWKDEIYSISKLQIKSITLKHFSKKVTIINWN